VLASAWLLSGAALLSLVALLSFPFAIPSSVSNTRRRRPYMFSNPLVVLGLLSPDLPSQPFCSQHSLRASFRTSPPLSISDAPRRRRGRTLADLRTRRRLTTRWKAQGAMPSASRKLGDLGRRRARSPRWLVFCQRVSPGAASRHHALLNGINQDKIAVTDEKFMLI